MIVMSVRHQYRIDRRQFIERDAGIVDAPGSGEADRRGTFGPDRIDQQVEAGGLDQPARMTDIGKPYLAVLDPRRRRIGWAPGPAIAAVPGSAAISGSARSF